MLMGFLQKIYQDRTEVTCHRVTTFAHDAIASPLGQDATNEKTPPFGGLVVKTGVDRVYPFTANFPRSVFWNRASFPFVLISRNMAE